MDLIVRKEFPSFVREEWGRSRTKWREIKEEKSSLIAFVNSMISVFEE